MTPIRAILWDLDGILIDTRQAHYLSWKQIAQEVGFDFSHEQFLAAFGMNNTGTLLHFVGPHITPEWIAEIGGRKEQLFLQMIHGNVSPIAGVVRWLEQFRAWGLRQVIASSAPPENIEALTSETGLAGYFEAAASGSQIPGKPAPDVFLLAAQLLRLPPAECLVIEDSPAGIEGARRAGMRCLAVETTQAAAQLTSATFITPSFDALQEDQIRTLLT